MLFFLNFISFSLPTWKKTVKGNEDIENVAANAEYQVEKMEVFPLNVKKIMVLAL